MDRIYDVIVIGSGFGGSVTALRLAESGLSVLVLERGKNYSAGDFPRDMQDTPAILWRTAEDHQHQGLYDMRSYSDVGVVTASGVGGGSLIYANVHMKPDAAVFENTDWPAEITLETLEPYYQKVTDELSLKPIPAEYDIPKRDLFHKASSELAVECIDPPQAIDWGTCKLCGECELGCIHNSKQSLDKTYLNKAMRLGAEIRANSEVSFIEPSFNGYLVHFRDLNHQAAKRQIKAKYVVVSAGTIGTNELLLKCRDMYETLPDISQHLGIGFSANGDFIGSIQNASESLSPWRGPDVTSVAKFSHDKQFFTLAAPSYSQAVGSVLATMGQPGGKFLRFVGPVMWQHFNGLLPWAMRKGLINKPLKTRFSTDPDRFTNLFAMGRDNANGVLRLNKQKLEISWDYYEENQSLINAMISKMKEFAQAYGGEFSPMLTWNMAERPIVVHPLGGCRMASEPEKGVVSLTGEVHGYPGLFVADASLIPTSLGYHPAMTISALVEHNCQLMIESLK